MRHTFFIGFITLLLSCGQKEKKTIEEIFKESADYSHTDTNRPQNIQIPLQKMANDKIIIIKNAKYADIRKAILQFCNIYNQKDFAAIPHLTKISENEFAITLPYDVTFDMFCYLLNYMYYPNDIFYKADIKAWATTKPDDIWITEKSANKKVMLFIPNDDDEHDNVFLTTADNIGYKLGFATGYETQLLTQPKMIFEKQTILLTDLTGKPTEELK